MKLCAEPECFCGERLSEDSWTHVETGSRWCFPDEPETPDMAAPV